MQSLALTAALACLLPALAAAQAPTPETFDDLARAAQEVLDSNPAQAATLYQKALGLKATWPEGWFYMGGALYRLNRYSEALEAFHKGLDLAPKNGAAWGFQALCEYELGQLDKALADIAKGEQLGLGSNNGFEAAVRQRAALILIRSSRFDQAMAQLEPLSKYQENSPAIIETVGLCALAIPSLPEQLPDARRKVVDMAGRAMWAGASKHPDQAQVNFKELLATYPNEPGVHYAYGLFLMDSDPPAALEELSKEIQSNPTHWPSLIASAFLETRQGNPDVAIQHIEQARKLAPTSYAWLCDAEMGRALLALDQPEKAIPLFEQSVKLQPDNAQAHFFLEQAYRRVGRKADAQREKAEFVRIKKMQDPLSLPGIVNSTSK